MDKCNEMKSAVLSDDRIIELYWKRNEKAIEVTDTKYGKMLFSIAYNILHDRSDCEECQNDTYLCIWNSIPPTRPVVFSAFISKVMRNTAIDKYKEKSAKKHIPSQLTVSIDELENVLREGDTPESEYMVKELGKILNDFVFGLSYMQRYIFIERWYLSAGLAGIAEELDVSISTVHRESEKIKRALIKHLERNGVIL